MPRRLSLSSCLLACFIATGCQWDLVQVVAWARMFAGYSQEMSLTAAAQKTFSGEMCGLCEVVQKGKQEQVPGAAKSPQSKVSGKFLDLYALTATVEVLSPTRAPAGIVANFIARSGRDRARPPSPPPRV